jgi:hypothetical protein
MIIAHDIKDLNDLVLFAVRFTTIITLFAARNVARLIRNKEVKNV